MMTYFLLFCLLLSHTEAKTISHPPAAPSLHHFPPLESSPNDSLLPRRPSPSPHHFWLVHTWPRGFCSHSPSVHCPQPPNLPRHLTIHGWWPVDREDNTLKNKQRVGSIKDVFEDKALYSDMITNWRNLTSPIEYRNGQISFWGHEWARHGRCSGFNPRLYFDRALALSKSIDVSQVLRANRIKPGSEYARSRFVTALSKKIPPNSFAMRCGHKNGKKILTEIRVCTSDTSAIDCLQLEKLKDNCGTTNINF